MITNIWYQSKKSAFSPTDIAGCKLWLKADAGITKDGGNYVSIWADQSGNGNDAVQATGSAQPLWVDDVLNGKPVLRFDGLDNWLEFNEIDNAISIFMVLKHRTGTGSYPITLGHLTTYDMNGGDGIYMFSSSYTSSYVLNGNLFVNSVITPVLSSIKPIVHSLFSIIATGNIRVETICNDRFVSNHLWDGDFAEIIIFDSALSDTDRQLVENYLNAKYALW